MKAKIGIVASLSTILLGCATTYSTPEQGEQECTRLRGVQEQMQRSITERQAREPSNYERSMMTPQQSGAYNAAQAGTSSGDAIGLAIVAAGIQRNCR